MIAIDTNILVYAHRRDSEWFDPAHSAMARIAETPEPWAIPWPCIHEFLAVVTHPRIYAPPTPVAAALQQVDMWMESPSLRLIGELGSYWTELRAILSAGRITGGAVHDARIAAICRANGVRELWSADRDFTRFTTLKVVNPLVFRPAA